jgi:glycosyltransferase involved in cell wall biosynthesis
MVVHNHYPLGEPRVTREARILVEHGYEVDVICLRGEGEPATDTSEGVRIYRLPVKRHRGSGPAVQLLEYLAFFSLALVKLAALHRERRYGVVQVHNLPDFLVFVGIVPKLTGARLILDIHDLMPEFYACRFKGNLKSWPVRLVCLQEQLACRFANRVITVSEHWRQTLIGRGVPAHKCSVVMNVADERIFTQNGNHRVSSDQKFRLLYHGTIVQRYGLDLAIQAIDQVRHDIPDIHLTILGRGDYVDTLIKKTQDLGLNQHVTIYNEMRPVTEIPAIIRSADLGIVPYRNDVFTDALLPTKLMEYAALGLPAIAARTTAIEAYFHNTMAELFEPGDVHHLAQCIRTLYSSPERLAELARGSQKFNEQYNWAKLGTEYVALVERLHVG